MSSLALDKGNPLAQTSADVDAKITADLKARGIKLSDADRRDREVRIAQMFLKGISKAEISRIFDLHPTTIAYFIKKAEADWREAAAKSINDIKAKELAKLDQLEATAWDAWERSKTRSSKQQLKTELIPSITDGHEPTRLPREARTTQEDRVGDPKYLDIIFKCIDKRMKVLGVSEIGPSEATISASTASIADRLGKYGGVLTREAVFFTGEAAGGADSGESVDPAGSARTPGGVPDIIDI